MDLCGLPHPALGSGANTRFRPGNDYKQYERRLFEACLAPISE